MNRVTAVIVAAFTATAASAESQPSHQFSMPTPAIAQHVARDIVREQICGLAPRPLPFAPPTSKIFGAMVVREAARLDALLADHGDDVICACIGEGQAICP